MGPLQDLCLQVLEKIHASGYISPFPFVRILYKMHISEPMSQHPYLRALCKIPVSRYITRSAAQDHLQDPCLRILYRYKTEVFVSMSQHPCLWVHIQAALSVGPLQDPCLRIHYKIRGSMSPHLCLSVLICGSYMQDPCLWSPPPSAIRPRPPTSIKPAPYSYRNTPQCGHAVWRKTQPQPQPQRPLPQRH